MQLEKRVGQHVVYVEKINGRKMRFRSNQPGAEERAAKYFEQARLTGGLATTPPHDFREPQYFIE